MSNCARVPEQVRRRKDIDNVRVWSVNEVLLRVGKSCPSSSLNDYQQLFTGCITRWRLTHKRGVRTPA